MTNLLCFISGAVMGALLMGMVIVSGNYDESEERNMMTVINRELERECRECQFHKVIIDNGVPRHICVACDTKEAEEWGKTHECPLK